MKNIISIIAGTCILVGTAVFVATAATPEDGYIAARDAAIKSFKGEGDIDEPTRKREEAARADLQKRLQAMLGQVAIKGIEAPPRLNNETLFEGDMGFGTLDGLMFGAVDAPPQVVVTTDGLMQRWLAGHKEWWGDREKMAQDLGAAATDNGFYTQAISTDAAVYNFAPLPIAKPAGARVAYAMLGARSQDMAPGKANEIFVTVAQGGRVYVAVTNTSVMIGPIAACEKICRDAQKKSDAEQAKAETAFLRCFAEKAPQSKNFATVVKDAEALLARLPLR